MDACGAVIRRVFAFQEGLRGRSFSTVQVLPRRPGPGSGVAATLVPFQVRPDDTGWGGTGRRLASYGQSIISEKRQLCPTFPPKWTSRTVIVSLSISQVPSNTSAFCWR
jgi:hypothetical protein